MPHGPVPGGLGKVSGRVRRVKRLLLAGAHKDTPNSATPPETLDRYFFLKRFDRQPVREVKYLQRYVRTKRRLGPTVPRPKETARVCLQSGTVRDLVRERRSPRRCRLSAGMRTRVHNPRIQNRTDDPFHSPMLPLPFHGKSRRKILRSRQNT